MRGSTSAEKLHYIYQDAMRQEILGLTRIPCKMLDVPVQGTQEVLSMLQQAVNLAAG